MNIEAIDRFLRKNNMSQTALESAAGLSKGQISQWKNRDLQPNMKSLAKLSAYTGISVNELMRESVSGEAAPPENVRDAYGTYIPVEENGTYDDPACRVTLIDEQTLTAASASGNYPLGRFGFCMNDSGMEPYIFEEDLLIIEKTPAYETGDIILAVADGKVLCRKAVLQNDGIILQPLSRDHAARYFSTVDDADPSDRASAETVSVIGRVIGISRKL